MAVPTPTIPPVTASLYVGDLHPDITDGQLFDAFSEFRSLASVRICRDAVTGRSLCYGYVNFVSPQDAIQAIEARNHSTLKDKVIRVMWSLRDPEARRSGAGNVFVKNLSETIDNAKLQETFQKFGSILSCKVAKSDDGKSRGYGFIQFETEDSAKASIEKLNGSILEGKQIYVGNFVKRCDRIFPSPDAKYTNLYMKNLDAELTEEHLQEKFSEFGKIVSLVISKDDNGVSRGFGFVNFDNPDDARRAMEALNGSQLGSKVLYVSRAQKKAEREELLRRQFEERRKERIMKYKGSNLYVKNIDDEVNDDELRALFSSCGTITSAKVMQDNKGISKGFGFVCFSNPEEAIRAANSFHGFMFHRKPLYVAIAQRKEERQAQLQIQYAQQMAGLAGPSAVMPGGYPIYYPAHPGVVPQVPGRPALMYQSATVRPGWRPNGFPNSARPGFQPSPVPFLHSNPRQPRQNRGRMNSHLPQGSGHAVSYVPTLQQSAQPAHASKELGNQQLVRYIPNGRGREVNIGSAGVSSAAAAIATPGPASPGMLSSMLAAASPEQQKQILGERLYPLVSNHKPEIAAKITGMLLEMDNSELLLLLESPEALTSKVEEAVEVLKLSKPRVSGQEALQPSFLSAEVAVN